MVKTQFLLVTPRKVQKTSKNEVCTIDCAKFLNNSQQIKAYFNHTLTFTSNLYFLLTESRITKRVGRNIPFGSINPFDSI